MNHDQDNNDRRIQHIALLFFLAGLAFTIPGAINVFSSYADMIDNLDSIGVDGTGMIPKYAWCLYVGLPLLGVATALRFYSQAKRYRR